MLPFRARARGLATPSGKRAGGACLCRGEDGVGSAALERCRPPRGAATGTDTGAAWFNRGGPTAGAGQEAPASTGGECSAGRIPARRTSGPLRFRGAPSSDMLSRLDMLVVISILEQFHFGGRWPPAGQEKWFARAYRLSRSVPVEGTPAAEAAGTFTCSARRRTQVR